MYLKIFRYGIYWLAASRELVIDIDKTHVRLATNEFLV